MFFQSMVRKISFIVCGTLGVVGELESSIFKLRLTLLQGCVAYYRVCQKFMG